MSQSKVHHYRSRPMACNLESQVRERLQDLKVPEKGHFYAYPYLQSTIFIFRLHRDYWHNNASPQLPN